MGRIKVFLMTMLVIFVLLLSFFLVGGSIFRYFKSGEVGWALKKAIRDKHMQKVVLKELTRFNWDELFIFEPYTPTSEVCKKLGLNSIECKELIKSESKDDGELLLVFKNQGKVVHVEIHFRFHGDFTSVKEESFTPVSAVFSVIKNGKSTDGQEWLQLSPK